MTLPEVEAELELPAGCKAHTHCRICKSVLPKPYLDLGYQPLANALHNPFAYTTAGPDERKYPLAVTLCKDCGLSQLTVVVDPKILYTHYRFSSGISKPWCNHTADLAQSLGGEYEANAERLVIDIAANDGTQLHQFKSLGWRVLGVEPSDIDTVEVGTFGNEVHADIPMIREFWSQDVADRIRGGHGLADVIVAQNVLGHVDDAIGFLKAVGSVLKPHGQLIAEVPNVGDMINNMAFDTVYHEHLSYWSGLAMERACREAGLKIERHERFPDLHGGTVRYYIEHSDELWGVDDWRGSAKPYEGFAHEVSRVINLTASIVALLSKKKFLAWGASAKGSVMMNAIHNRWPALKMPSAIIDQTPGKQGLLSPGLHIPVIAPPDDLSDIDVIWVLSWNWFEQIKYQAIPRGFKGKFLVTSPKPKLLS